VLIPPGYEPHLAAVTAAPFDDLPRLAMADWLDEHGGGEWAAYIREQVAAYDWSRPLNYQLEAAIVDGRPPYIQHRLAKEMGCRPPLQLLFSRGFPMCMRWGYIARDVEFASPWPIVMLYVPHDSFSPDGVFARADCVSRFVPIAGPFLAPHLPSGTPHYPTLREPPPLRPNGRRRD